MLRINLGTANGGMEYLRQRNYVTPMSGLIHRLSPTYQLVICSNRQPWQFRMPHLVWNDKLGTANDTNTISKPPMIKENHHAIPCLSMLVIQINQWSGRIVAYIPWSFLRPQQDQSLGFGDATSQPTQVGVLALIDSSRKAVHKRPWSTVNNPLLSNHRYSLLPVLTHDWPFFTMVLSHDHDWAIVICEYINCWR